MEKNFKELLPCVRAFAFDVDGVLSAQLVPMSADATQAVERLSRLGIDHLVQDVGGCNVNIYFGRPQCVKAVRPFVSRPLYDLTPEEDFILGALLGYDICLQCERYCSRRGAAS